MLQSISKDADGLVSSMSATLNLAGDVKKTKWKLTWLPDNDELIPLTLTDFDYLITKKKVWAGCCSRLAYVAHVVTLVSVCCIELHRSMRRLFCLRCCDRNVVFLACFVYTCA